MYKPKRITKD